MRNLLIITIVVPWIACADWTIKATAYPSTVTTIPDQGSWVKYVSNPIITTNLVADTNAVYEPAVCLPTYGAWSNNTTQMFMLHSAGQGIGTNDIRIKLATSVDGTNWVSQLGRAVIGNGYAGFSNACRASLMQHTNGVFYATASDGWGANGDSIHMLYSTDCTNWTDTGKVLIPPQSGWEHRNANSCLWCEIVDGKEVWRIMYESYGGSIWAVGLATATNVAGTGPTNLTWARSSSNPLSTLQVTSGSYSHPKVIPYKLNGNWHMWLHCSPGGVTPSYIFHKYSADLITWSPWPTNNTAVFGFTQTSWEGVGNTDQQLADPHIIERNGQTLLYYDADDNNYNGTHTLFARIGMATYSGTLTQLVTVTTSAPISIVSVTANAIDKMTSSTDPSVTNGLALWYRFTDGSGSTITDNSGNSKNATTYNTPTWTGTNTAGYGAMTFTRASSQYATIPSLSLGTNFALACWIYENSPSSVGYQGAICFSAQSTGGRGSILCNSGATYWDWSQAIGVGIGTYVQSAWHHYAYTYNGVKWTTYYDGTQFGTANKGDGGSVGEVIDRVGVLGRYYTDYNGHYLNAKLADVRVYSRPITATEVATIYSLSGHP